MDDKIKILEEYMNSLNYGMYIPNSSIFFIRHDEKENSIELILEAIIGIQHYSGARIIKYDCNNFKFYSYTGKEKNYKDTSIGSWIKKYEEAFKDKCKELFEGDNKMEEQKIIEVTNLDELQKLLSDSKKLVCKLQSKIDKINNWQPKYKEKEEDKIDLLNKRVKEELDEDLEIMTQSTEKGKDDILVLRINNPRTGVISLGCYYTESGKTRIDRFDKFLEYTRKSNVEKMAEVYSNKVFLLNDFFEICEELYGVEK